MWPCPLSLRTRAHRSALLQASGLLQQRLLRTVTCTCPKGPGVFALAASKCNLSESPWTESSNNIQTQPAARSARYFRRKRKRRTAYRLPAPAVHLHSRAVPLQLTGLLPPPPPLGALSSERPIPSPSEPCTARTVPTESGALLCLAEVAGRATTPVEPVSHSDPQRPTASVPWCRQPGPALLPVHPSGSTQGSPRVPNLFPPHPTRRPQSFSLSPER